MTTKLIALFCEDVSSRARVEGSDYDWNIWLPGFLWQLVHLIGAGIGLGKLVRSHVIRTEWGIHEWYINNNSHRDPISIATSYNARVQDNWDEETERQYRMAKEAIAHLRGRERKVAKARLADEFDLDPRPYILGGEAPIIDTIQKANDIGLLDLWLKWCV